MIKSDVEFDIYYKSLLEKVTLKLKKTTINYEKRLKHCINVSNMAYNLVNKYDKDNIELKQKAKIAGLIHDYCKYDSFKTFLNVKDKYNLQEELNINYIQVYHGHIGYLIIKDELQIEDLDILNAVKYHVMGKEDLSFLEAVIYLSDYIEESRIGHEFEEVRNMAFNDFNKAIAKETYNTMNYLLKSKKEIHPNELLTYNYYIKYLY